MLCMPRFEQLLECLGTKTNVSLYSFMVFASFWKLEKYECVLQILVIFKCSSKAARSELLQEIHCLSLARNPSSEVRDHFGTSSKSSQSCLQSKVSELRNKYDDDDYA